MRFKIAAALAALPFAATANAANVYSACYYQDDLGNLPVTQLFTLKGDALRDYYGEWTYEKNLVWEVPVSLSCLCDLSLPSVSSAVARSSPTV